MATVLKATIEKPARVNPVTFNHIFVAQSKPSLDEAQAYLEEHFLGVKSWFVYRGGSHLALHRHSASGSIMGPRIAIIVEQPDRLSCGCCRDGCTCHNHMDIPRGIRPCLCAKHGGPMVLPA